MLLFGLMIVVKKSKLNLELNILELSILNIKNILLHLTLNIKNSGIPYI